MILLSWKEWQGRAHRSFGLFRLLLRRCCRFGMLGLSELMCKRIFNCVKGSLEQSGIGLQGSVK